MSDDHNERPDDNPLNKPAEKLTPEEARRLIEEAQAGLDADEQARHWEPGGLYGPPLPKGKKAPPDDLPPIEAYNEPSGRVVSMPKPKEQPEFPVTAIDGLLDKPPSLNWLVENMIEAGTLGVMFGDEGTKKSFIALDLALCIATGSDYHGRRVVQSRVLYLAGEGRDGIIRRAKGWFKRKAANPTPDLFLGDVGANMMDVVTVSSIRRTLKRLTKEGQTWGLVVVDTVARAMCGASDNRPEDMGLFITHLDDHIRKPTGATTLGIHHTPLETRDGKGKPRPRGHSSLAGACDFMMAVEYDPETEIGTLTVVKQKDGSAGAPLNFKFEQIELGLTDNFGNPITTLVPYSTDEKPTPRQQKTSKPLEYIQRAIEIIGNNQKDNVRAQFYALYGDDGETGRKAFTRGWKQYEEIALQLTKKSDQS